MTHPETPKATGVNSTTICKACGHVWDNHGVGGNCLHPAVDLAMRGTSSKPKGAGGPLS